MSYILSAQGYHDKAIAQKWSSMFQMLLWGIQQDKKEKIWRVVVSCKDEEQLRRYYGVVKNYTDCLAFFDTFNLSSWSMWHTYKLMRFL